METPTNGPAPGQKITLRGKVIVQAWKNTRLLIQIHDDAQNVDVVRWVIDAPRDADYVGTDRVIEGTVRRAQWDARNARWMIELDEDYKL